MDRFASRIMLMLAVGGLIVSGCKKAPTVNSAPTITALDLPESVDISVDATFICTASDPDSEALAYNWTCSSGSLQSATGSAVVWTAPDTSGAATVTAIVQDSSGASDTMSGTVTVNAVSTTIIDWSGVVAALDAKVQTRDIPAGYTVSGSFSAVGQDITFLVLDNDNYGHWRNSEPYAAIVKVDTSAGSGFSAVIDSSAFYNFILDNTYNVNADTSVHLFVQRTSP
jgi:hypothetical protein